MPSLLERVNEKYVNYQKYTEGINTIVFLFILWHWISCFWYFTNNQIESEEHLTWIAYHSLHEEPLIRKYIMSMYFTMNMLTAGYGDMFPTSDT